MAKTPVKKTKAEKQNQDVVAEAVGAFRKQTTDSMAIGNGKPSTTVSQSEINGILWKACDTFRGAVDSHCSALGLIQGSAPEKSTAVSRQLPYPKTRAIPIWFAKLSASMLQVDGDSVGGKVEIDFHDVPVSAEAKQLPIMGVEIVHLHRIQNHRRSDDLPLNSPKSPSIRHR